MNEIIQPPVFCYDAQGKLLSFETWHLIDNKWYHIAQTFGDSYRRFFTDGRLSNQHE